MSNIVRMDKKELINFIIVYGTTTHIAKEDKRLMLEETLDQFYTEIDRLTDELQTIKGEQ